MKSSATLSLYGRWRYTLQRQWDDDASMLPFVMLNPSTADAHADDPTIRRCMGFARREGYGGIFVANLFALRSPNPEDVAKASELDALGPKNLGTLVEVVQRAAAAEVPIVCAWGASLPGLYRMSDWFKRRAQEGNAKLSCLGTTQTGHPRHPLYVKGDQPLVAFH